MKILFISPYVPSLVRIRPYNLIRALAARGHAVTLATLWSNQQEKKDLDPLRSVCTEIIAQPMPVWRSLINSLMALPSRTPLQAVYSWQPNLLAAIKSKYTSQSNLPYDIVHIEHLRGSRYGQELQQFFKTNGLKTPVIWDSVDCISLLFQYTSRHTRSLRARLIAMLEVRRTALHEARLAKYFNHTVLTSQNDRSAILALDPEIPSNRVTAISQGVDLDYFQPDPAVTRDPKTLVLSGKMSYHANVAMAQYIFNEIMPLIWAERSDIRLLIVGKDPPESIQNFAHHPNVEITGTVKDIRPYLQKAAVAVAPLRYAVGIQNKVLEAMACATPVVTTSQVTASISAVPGQDLLVGDDAHTFAQSVLSLLNSDEKRLTVGNAGYRYTHEHHSWSKVAAGLEEIYRSEITHFSANPPQ